MHPSPAPACALASANLPCGAGPDRPFSLAILPPLLAAKTSQPETAAPIGRVAPVATGSRPFAALVSAGLCLAFGLVSALATTPNDPRYLAGDQWSLHNIGIAGGVVGADIRAAQAWSVLHDSPEIIIAVVDSGVRFTHEDLAANMWVNPGESGLDSLGRDKRTNGIDDDGNGYIDDVHGINVLNHSGDPSDDWGHGTDVAGIVGAVGNNGVGIAGINWRVKIMACKFIDAGGNYAVADAITALAYARANGARVITAAWGKTTFTSAALREAVIALRDANIILVAAAGNDGGNNDVTPLYPAAYEYSNVVTAAATDRLDALASFSNYGLQSVDLGAPGANVLSCWSGSDSDYRENSGSSFSAAHVAGACALLWTRYPAYSHQQIINRLITTVDPLPGLAGKTVSGGRLNLAAALGSTSIPVVTSGTTATATVGAAFTYQITATNAPLSYAATNLTGTGLILNAATGVIAGSPTSPGNIITQLTATSSTDTSVAVTLSITVVAAPLGDVTPPNLASFAFDFNTVTNSSGTFVATFSEPVTGVDATDFVINTQGTATATITGVTAVSATAYRVTFDYTGTSGSVQMAIKTSATGIIDAASNVFAGSGSTASDVVPFLNLPPADSTPPVASTFTAGTATTSAVTFALTFNEPVTGVNGSDFVILSSATLPATLGTVTADVTGTVYTIPVTFGGTGTLQLMVLGGATANIRDAATNWFAGGSGQLSPTVTIGSSGAPPAITSATAATATVGTAFTYPITATNSPTAYAATNLAGTGLSLNHTSGVITGAPVAAGAITTQLTATNATGTSAAVTLTITVNAAPAVPTITSGITATGTAGTAFTYQITATNSPTAYAATNLAGTGLSLNHTSGVITGAPVAAGAIPTQLTATNATGTSAAVTLTITVNAVPAVPAIISPATASATVGTAFTYQIAATNSPTSYAAVVLTGTGLSLNEATGLLSGVPASAGTITLQLTASNATGASAPLNLTINVSSAGLAPVITSALTATVTTGTSFSYTVTASNAPTSFSAGNLPAGLTFVAPNIAGAVNTAGTYLITLGATNAVGSATQTLVLTVAAAPPPPPPPQPPQPPPPSPQSAQQIIFAPGSVVVGEPVTLTATSTAGLPVSFVLVSGNATLVGDVLTAKNRGAIVLRAFNNGNAGTSGGSTTVTLNARDRQTLTLHAPSGGLVMLSPVTLSATTSAGELPLTFSLVSGNATLVGNTLTAKGPGTIIVRTSQSGNDTYAAASADTIFGSPGKASQSIACPSIGDTTVTGGPIPVTATASSGLPTSLAVSGPARLSGNSIVLTGIAGIVTLRATASGNEIYSPAPDLLRTFSVRAVGQQVYLGTMGSDPFAIVISQDGTNGIFLARFAASGEAIIARFTLDAAGSFQVRTLGALTATPVSASDQPAVAAAAVPASRTVNGTVNNGVVSGSIAELDARFTANVSPPTGPVAALSGVYVAAIPGAASGDAYLVAAPDGTAFAVAVTPFDVTSGNGTIINSGEFTIATSGGGTLTGQVDGTNGSVQGTLITPKNTATLVGLSEATRRSDRLVNLSARLRVVGGDASRSVIAGFVVAGAGAKPILVRAVGPGLTGFGVQDALANPRLQLYRGSSLIAENDDWSNDPKVGATGDGVGAFKLAANSRDAALLATLEPGAYTAIVTGVNGNGVVLVEVYDAATGDAISAQQLVNLSTRGFVDAGEGNLIAGFVVTGNAPKRVLIRGIGPGLAQFGVSGVVPNPTLTVYAAGRTAPVAQNDDWSVGQPVTANQAVASAAELATAAAATGAFALPAGSRDSALLITLTPGNYTAVVSGANNATGVGMVEVYELSNP